MTTSEQRMASLQLANHIRTVNARTLREISAMPAIQGVDEVISLLRTADASGPVGALSMYRILTDVGQCLHVNPRNL